MALTGRLSNTSYMGFQYSVENVVDHLTTTGITAIPGERRSIEELEGMSWHLKPPEQTSVRVPSRVAVNERLNRSVSLRFERYRQTPQPPRYSVDQHDRERNDNLDEDEEHFIGICLQAPQEEHISYDVCFCESCLNEARILEEEPLNKVRRSNKPKRSRQRSREKWSTLGEPSGKWDYYVRYDAPPDTTPIEEIAATGWGDEFSDDEVTPGKVTILEERSDWDDDERSGGKILVIQEKLAQNQQEFLDEYLPQWDEQLAIQKQESESEWENPFAAKRGENHTILHLSKEEENDDLPYPKFRNFKQMAAQIIKKHEEHAFPSSSSQIESTQSYQPPHDSIMGPPVYPPAQQNPQPFYRPDYQFGYPQGKSKIFSGGYGEYYNSQWTLPPAWTESGVMLVLPADPGLWSEVISRWESITINRLNNQTWSDNKAKLAFVENLLGESEKLMWQQWRTAYPGAYSALEAIADEPQNITSQVRQLILLEDPYRGSTDEQDRAYRDLDRITCEDTKNLWSFLEDFRQLATKSGRLYFPSTTEKLFAKLPPSLSKKIEESFRAKHPGLSSGVLPAIKFTHTFVSEMCKDAALAKELRDLSLCSAIPIPENTKTIEDEWCKYFICGKEGHFAKDCISKQGNITRSAVYQELDLDDNWDIVSADFDDSSVYSISEGEAIPGERRSIEELERMSWHLKPAEQTSVRVPSRVAVNERLNRSVWQITESSSGRLQNLRALVDCAYERTTKVPWLKVLRIRSSGKELSSKTQLVVGKREKLKSLLSIGWKKREDDVEPSVILGRSFMRLTKGIADFGNGIITIHPELDPFLDNSKETKKFEDDWDHLLDIDFRDIPEIDEAGLPPFICKMERARGT
ncbi:Orf y [Tanacetum coccineum]